METKRTRVTRVLNNLRQELQRVLEIQISGAAFFAIGIYVGYDRVDVGLLYRILAWQGVFWGGAILMTSRLLYLRDIQVGMTLWEWVAFRRRLRKFRKQMDTPGGLVRRPAPSKPPEPS